MTTERRFVFSFEVSDAMLRDAPILTARLIDGRKADIAAQEYVKGPRGGTYRLITPPDEWRVSNQYHDDWMRGVTRYATRRTGRYVRPKP